jgi:DNA modification methylase
MIKKVNIKEVKENPNNPRYVVDSKFKKLVKSIKEFPEMLEKRPIVVDENMIVLGGNMRLKACKSAGLFEVYIHQAIGWTEEQKQEFIIKDNVGFGDWDWDILANEWDTKKLNEWGLDLPEFDEIQLDAEEDDYTEPEQMKVDVVLGDLIEIGSHRLLCGDSTDVDQVAKLMNGKKADMVFTDPPYLMDFQGGIHADGSKSYNSRYESIKNDKMSEKDGEAFLDKINFNINLYCEGAFYITFYRLGIDKYYESLKRIGLKSRSLIIWNKGNHTLSNSDYMSKYEPIFYGWVNKHNFYGGNNGMDIWDIKRTSKNELHPTMKPIELCNKAINDGSKKNEYVLDLFLGSGSTMVAAHQLKRKCYGMELDPKYCQVIIDRMLKLDPDLKVKINGKKYK